VNISGEIRYFFGEQDHARLKFSENVTSLSIDTIMVPSAHRNEGIGTLLISRVLLLADQLGKDVHVTARPLGNRGEDRLMRLVAYYERFGFERREDGYSSIYLVRPCRNKEGSTRGAPV